MIRSKVSTRVLSGAFALALVAAACSGSDGQDITAERELEEFNNTTTVAPDPDPTTTLAPTTTTEGVETTTTAATTTTTLAPTEEQQKTEIIAAVEAYREAWRECLRQLPNCATSVLSETRTGNQLKVSTELAEEWNSLGYRAENIDSLTTRVDVVRFFDDALDVEIEACESDGVVILKGDDVIDDEYVSANLYLQILEKDGVWKVFRVSQDRAASGAEYDLCA